MIIPSIDLMQEKIVRLYQGNYEKKIFYNISPISLINNYIKENISSIHIVDLDAANNPFVRQVNIIKKLVKHCKNISVQVGGGIRNEKHIEELLSAGVKKVVIGSIAIKNPKKFNHWIKKYGNDTIVLSLDILINESNKKIIKIHGWKENSKQTLEDVINSFKNFNLKHVLCTDISKDGTLNGPNISLYKELTKKFHKIHFQSSGGIGSLSDVINLKKTKVKKIIIGKALLEKKFRLTEAVQC